MNCKGEIVMISNFHRKASAMAAPMQGAFACRLGDAGALRAADCLFFGDRIAAVRFISRRCVPF